MLFLPEYSSTAEWIIYCAIFSNICGKYTLTKLSDIALK